MDSVIHRLQQKLKQDPSNQVVQRALSHLATAKTQNGVDDPLYNALAEDLDSLQRNNVIEAADLTVLKDLLLPSAETKSRTHVYTSNPMHTDVKGASKLSADDLRYVEANLADSTIPRLAVSSDTPTVLPVELMESLKQTYFLHFLATDPTRVLPPGKSLLSALSRPHLATQHGSSALEQRVEKLVHAAFWEEVRRATIPWSSMEVLTCLLSRHTTR